MSSPSSNISLAILDDYPGIAPKHFSHLSELKIDSYPETLNAAKQEGIDALVKRLQPYQVISTMRERTAFPAELQSQLPNLKLLLTTGPRNASIDLEAASKQNIVVTGTVGGKPKKPENFSTDDVPPPPEGNSVNQHSWALLLGLCARLARDDSALKNDPQAWQSGLAIPLGGKVLGLVGLGKLGTLMAKTAVQGFGMTVIAWSANLDQDKADKAAEGAGLAKGTFKAVTKDELFRQADVLSLQLVLSERSKGIVGERELGMMKESALLLNISRGGLIDEAALLKVLKEGRIRGAALDVFWEEPLPADSPWRSKDFKSEVVLSPHMGYVNAGTMNKWYEEQAENVERWLRGEELSNRMN
ncbi:hypothetical protein LTR37_010159 [Vermiconidia calcicola]|uniref:Uncharacterized protein n=1 Tax=Vermiconidia calcicola TaxID=1690605 RepID=A0ACC3N5V8_9PEZI|nr:hypothetical protein LTR37_010159 [Vermiconidia calcicola]